MKNKEEKELIAEFKNLEKQLIEILKSTSLDYDDNDGSAIVKKNLKKYIKKVEEAKTVLLEYENVAMKLNELSSNAADSSEQVAKEVVALRKEPRVKNLMSEIQREIDKDDKFKIEKDEEQKENDEVLLVEGKPVVIKRKKKISGKGKEF